MHNFKRTCTPETHSNWLVLVAPVERVVGLGAAEEEEEVEPDMDDDVEVVMAVGVANDA